MKPRAPFGFFVAGCFSAWFGVTMLVALLILDSELDSSPDRMLTRGATALLAALAGVVTEALWRARPWAWRASLVMALVYVAAVAAVFGSKADGVETVLAVLVSSGVVLMPILAYIRSRCRMLWPPTASPPARISVPPPSARPHHPYPGARP